MRFGVDIARRAGLARESLRNCRSAELLLRQRAELAGGRRAVATGIKRSTSGLSLAFDEQPRTFDRFFGDSPEIALGDFSVVGIDLTAGASRASGWALLRGREAATRSLRSDDDLISATLDSGASLVSIDSPLSLPKGRCCAREDCPCRSHGILRESERTLMTMRVGVFPCLLPSMSALTLRGIRLAATLRERGVEVIESYPGAAQDVLGISRKSRGLELLVQGLTGFGIKLPTNHTLTHDELDAITSGLVGYFWHAGQYFGLGIPEENYLIVPRVPKFRENSQATVLGLAGPVAAGKTTVGQYLAFKYGFRYTRYSLVLRQFLSQPRQDLSRVEMQDFGQHVHETVGPVKLTQRVISQMTPAENWVVDGLRHVGDYETFLDELGLRFHMVFIEASEANRLRRIGHRNAGSAIRENHAVESEVPLLSFRTTLRVDNNRSFRHLFEQVDRILGVR
jgi:predicted nuclease with RNAse H fold/dephospho-CoA kinase